MTPMALVRAYPHLGQILSTFALFPQYQQAFKQY